MNAAMPSIGGSPLLYDSSPRVTDLIRAILWTQIGIGTLVLIVTPFVSESDDLMRNAIAIGFGYLQWGGMLVLNAKGKTRLASQLFVVGGIILVTGIVVTDGGVQSVVAGWYVIAILAAGLLLGGRAAVATALACTLLTLTLALLEVTGHLPASKTTPLPLVHWIGIFYTLIGTAGIQHLAARTVSRAMRQTHEELRDRKHAEATLRSREAILASILDSIPQAVFWKDRNGVYLGCNGVFARAVGFDRPDLVAGKTDLDFRWPQHERESYRLDDLRVIKENTPRLHIVEPLQKADGSRLWVDTSKLPLLDEQGEVSGVLGVFDDITDRLKADEALRKSELLYRALIENTPDIVASFDDTGRFLFVNSAIHQVTRIPAREFVGKRVDETGLFPREHATHSLEIIKNVFRSQMPFESDFEFQAPDRTIIFEWRTFPAVDSEGKVISVFSIYRDITSRKRTEEALRQSMAQVHMLSSGLEATREQERKAMAREVHDELGQILTAIKLGVENADPRRIEDRNKAQEKLRTLLELIERGMQAVHRISARLRPMILDDLGLVAAIKWQVNEFHRHSGIAFTLSLPDSEPEVSEDRSTALFRILGELLTNVARHAKASHVQVSLCETPLEFALVVKDDGVGISECAKENPNSLGLKGIEERLYPFGGKRLFAAVSGTGTEVQIHLPKAVA